MSLNLIRMGVLNQSRLKPFDWQAHQTFIAELVALAPEPYAAYWDVAAPNGALTPESAPAINEGQRVANLPNLISGSPIGAIVFPNEPSFLTFQHIYSDGNKQTHKPALSTALLFNPAAWPAAAENFFENDIADYVPVADMDETSLLTTVGFTVAFQMSFSLTQAAALGLEFDTGELPAWLSVLDGNVVVMAGSSAGVQVYVNGVLDEGIAMPTPNGAWTLSTLATFGFLFGSLLSAYPFAAFQRAVGMAGILNEQQIIDLSNRLLHIS